MLQCDVPHVVTSSSNDVITLRSLCSDAVILGQNCGSEVSFTIEFSLYPELCHMTFPALWHHFCMSSSCWGHHVWWHHPIPPTLEELPPAPTDTRPPGYSKSNARLYDTDKSTLYTQPKTLSPVQFKGSKRWKVHSKMVGSWPVQFPCLAAQAPDGPLYDITVQAFYLYLW